MSYLMKSRNSSHVTTPPVSASAPHSTAHRFWRSATSYMKKSRFPPSYQRHHCVLTILPQNLDSASPHSNSLPSPPELPPVISPSPHEFPPEVHQHPAGFPIDILPRPTPIARRPSLPLTERPDQPTPPSRQSGIPLQNPRLNSIWTSVRSYREDSWEYLSFPSHPLPKLTSSPSRFPLHSPTDPWPNSPYQIFKPSTRILPASCIINESRIDLTQPIG